MLTNLTLSTLIMTLCVLREVPQLWLPAALIDNTIDLGGVAPAHDRLAKIRPLSLSLTTCQSGMLLNHCNQFIHSVRKQMLYSITGRLLSPWLLFMLRIAFFSCFKLQMGQNTVLETECLLPAQHCAAECSGLKVKKCQWSLLLGWGLGGAARSANTTIHKTMRFSSWSLAGK